MAETITITIPQETVNDETVRILSWKVVSGTLVEKEQFICDVETSKAVMEIHAPSAGIVRYSAAVGDEVPVGSMICEIIPEGQELVPALVAATVDSKAAETGLPLARFTPLARSIAAECGIDQGAFPPGTLVRSNDVLTKAGRAVPKVEARPGSNQHPSHENRPAKQEGQAANDPVAGVPVDWVDLERRKVLESRILGMGRAACIQSSVTLICRAPKLNKRVDKLGLPTAGRSALIIFEVARLLHKYPMFNALHDRGRVGRYREVNTGWAIDGGQGLVVPVIKNADQKGLREIAAIMEQHVEAYVGGSLTPSDFVGGTITISDLSADGVSFFEPLISQGQSAILGVGSDMASEGESLYLTLAFDHQVGEGRSAAQFLRELSGRLEVHSELENTPPPLPESEKFCVLCQRDGTTLRKLNAILITSEIPPGSVCSFCMAGF